MDRRPDVTERLLEQQQFLRHLARGLAGDEASADDLVQDTLAVALEHSPREGPSRPWLATVLRRLALNDRRGRRRRLERERRAARAESQGPDVEALDRRLDVQTVLSVQLRALPADQARALALRYGDGLALGEIARLTDSPEGTVKTRLRRGLARLRADLDARFPREAWALALAPLRTADAAGLPPAPAAASAARLARSSVTRGVAVAAAAGLAAGALLWALWPGSAVPAGGAARVAAVDGRPEAAVRAGLEPPGAGALEGRSARDAAAPDPDTRGTREGAPRGEGATGGGMRPAPPAGAERELPRLAARFADPAAPAAYLRVTFVGDADDVLAGRLWFESADFQRRRDVELRARGGAVERQTDLAVPARADVTVGAVVDGFTVEPLAVRAAGPGEWTDVTLVLAPDPELAWLTLLLDPGAGVEGAAALEGERWLLTVHAEGAELERPLRSPSVRDGRLDVGGVAPGAITVRGVQLAAAQSGAREALVLLARADLVRGARAEVRAQVAPGGSFRIEALGVDGAPRTGRVEVERPGGARWPVRLRSSTRWSSELDADGTSVIVPPLAPGPAVLHVVCAGHRAAQVDVVVRSGEVQPIAVHLEPD